MPVPGGPHMRLRHDFAAPSTAFTWLAFKGFSATLHASAASAFAATPERYAALERAGASHKTREAVVGASEPDLIDLPSLPSARIALGSGLAWFGSPIASRTSFISSVPSQGAPLTR